MERRRFLLTSALGGMAIGLKHAFPGFAEERVLHMDGKKNLVGICYSTWFNPVVAAGKPIHDISKILAANPQDPKWGPSPAFHYWAEPAPGYYASTDRAVIRTHMRQFVEAGIDFIILDNTNFNLMGEGKFRQNTSNQAIVYDAFPVLLDTMAEIRREGGRTPAVVVWVKNKSKQVTVDDGAAAEEMWKEFYSRERWRDLFVHWKQKPFLLVTHDGFPETTTNRFTVRKMWGLQKILQTSEWSFLQHPPQAYTHDEAGNVEQMCVCAAAQRSYMTQSDATGRDGGKTFREEWRLAFEKRPKVVTLTWWNEWMAQRFIDPATGKTRFVDNYTREFSRDLEPMKGGHGDLYYKWMVRYIAAYKAGQPCPEGLLESGFGN